jgi:hypothetical protein
MPIVVPNVENGLQRASDGVRLCSTGSTVEMSRTAVSAINDWYLFYQWQSLHESLYGHGVLC